MSHFKEMPYFSGLHLLTLQNRVSVPQDIFNFHNMVGIDSDGNTVRMFDLKSELEGKYFVIIFLPMDLTFDSEEVLSIKASLESFEAEGCQVSDLFWEFFLHRFFNVFKVVGITADSPMVTSRWIRLDWKIFWGDKKSLYQEERVRGWIWQRAWISHPQ